MAENPESWGPIERKIAEESQAWAQDMNPGYSFVARMANLFRSNEMWHLLLDEEMASENRKHELKKKLEREQCKHANEQMFMTRDKSGKIVCMGCGRERFLDV